MVRLKQMLTDIVILKNLSLNSTMVRLKQMLTDIVILKNLSLNSTMVRLKLYKIPPDLFLSALSQFHYGSIKTQKQVKQIKRV